MLVLLFGCHAEESSISEEEQIIENLTRIYENEDGNSVKWHLYNLEYEGDHHGLNTILAFERLQYFNDSTLLRRQEYYGLDHLHKALRLKDVDELEDANDYFIKYLESERLEDPLFNNYIYSKYLFDLPFNVDQLELCSVVNTDKYKSIYLKTYYEIFNNEVGGIRAYQNSQFEEAKLNWSELHSQISKDSTQSFDKHRSSLAFQIALALANNSDLSKFDLYFEDVGNNNPSKSIRDQANIVEYMVEYFIRENRLKDSSLNYSTNCVLVGNILEEDINTVVSAFKADTLNLEELLDVFAWLKNSGDNLSFKEQKQYWKALVNWTYDEKYFKRSGYKIEIYQELLNILLIELDKVSLKNNKEAFELLKEFRAYWFAKGLDKDVVHQSDFINELGLAELKIHHKRPNFDHPDEIIRLHNECKNRLLSRSLLIAENIGFTLNEKIKVEGLDKQISAMKSKLTHLKGNEYFKSDLHHKLYDLFLERKEMLVNGQQENITKSLESFDLMKIQDNLSINDAQLIDMLYDDEYCYLLSITSNEVRSHAIRFNDNLKQQIADFKKKCFDPQSDIDSIQISGSEIYTIMFEEVIDTSKYNLVISPNGLFTNFPFAALTVGDKYLIETVKLSYVPNLKYIEGWTQEKIKIKSMSFVGFSSEANEGDDQFPPLRNNIKEFKTLQEFGSAKEVHSYLGYSLGQDEFIKSFQSDIVHIATHSVSDPLDKFGSYFVVWDNQIPIQIYGYQLQPSLINAKLVLLNACATNVGPTFKGEGLFSLTNSLLKKPGLNVITTINKINDQAASRFIEEFYGFLNTRKMPGIALNLSQVRMISKSRYKHPYYWASYEYYGDLGVRI